MPKAIPKYEKLDPISHILKRPDMYVGSLKSQKECNEWIANINDINSPIFVKVDEIKYSPALLRIFVEAVSNAIDNVWRSQEANIPCTKIKIDINRETGETKVWNDGLGIPIEIDEETGIYNPELIFGHLLTSSNYDDDEERLTSGRNGLGIKLTNVFSKSFKIKIFNKENEKSYAKEWSDNMRKSSKAKIGSPSAKNSFTEVSWIPDFEKFGCDGLSDDILSVYYKYVYDTAMLTKVNVYLNGTKVPIKSLLDYAKCFNGINPKEVLFLKTDNCEVVIGACNHEQFDHVAFTNGVYNKDGGLHVDSWSQALFRPLVTKFNKPKKPQINIKDVKQFFQIFISATLVNPEFSNQSKTKLTSPNVKATVSTKTISSIMKWSVTERIAEIIKGKELLSLKKTEKGRKSFRKIVGFDPANNAGSKMSKDCTLILCEGLSAKTYAVVGIDVGFNGKRGRDWYGIYPLRGKLLNVRNASIKSISENKEITDVIQALGLHHGLDYSVDSNFNNLNYGKVMIMCDADVDGIHIASLIMNFIHCLFPSLVKRPNPFIVSMQTPIAKILGSNSKIFYREENFRRFVKDQGDVKLKIKYYKGLGTSSDEEVRQTFGKKVIEYFPDEQADFSVDKVFNSKCADKRKTWLENYDPDYVLDIPDDERLSRMSISNFIDIDLIKFSIDDCGRSIPNVYDGLKQSHRKILYAIFLKNLRPGGKSMKVAQLAGFIAEKTNYHHGEVCLFDTITKMAQDFPGSNNVPYFEKDGQFGTRLHGGKDAANARYIFTKMTKLVRAVFPEDDDILLNFIIDDGDTVEPEFYMPILPMILVNGCTAGIGTGWSCSVPNYNPLDIVRCVKTWLNNDNSIFRDVEEDGEVQTYSLLPDLTPWYNKYDGVIKKISDTRFQSFGNVTREKNKAIVNELPIGLWTEKFKDQLEDLLEAKLIKGIKNYSTPKEVKFQITESENGINCTVDTLKLKTNLSISNMVLFYEQGKLKKFDSIDEIIDCFCKKRYEFYVLRKKRQLEILYLTLKYLKNKRKFLYDVMNDRLVIYKKSDVVLFKELEDSGFEKKDDNFDYLLGMHIRSFTKEKLEKLGDESNKLEKDIKALEKITEKDLWLRDIDNFCRNL